MDRYIVGGGSLIPPSSSAGSATPPYINPLLSEKSVVNSDCLDST